MIPEPNSVGMHISCEVRSYWQEADIEQRPDFSANFAYDRNGSLWWRAFQRVENEGGLLNYFPGSEVVFFSDAY